MAVQIVFFQRIFDTLESVDLGNYFIGGDKWLFSPELSYVGTDVIDHPTAENHPFRAHEQRSF
jgi:hypothetical protein